MNSTRSSIRVFSLVKHHISRICQKRRMTYTECINYLINKYEHALKSVNYKQYVSLDTDICNKLRKLAKELNMSSELLLLLMTLLEYLYITHDKLLIIHLDLQSIKTSIEASLNKVISELEKVV